MKCKFKLGDWVTWKTGPWSGVAWKIERIDVYKDVFGAADNKASGKSTHSCGDINKYLRKATINEINHAKRVKQ